PAEIVAKELEIAKEKFRQEGKPEAMLDKISQGALAKFFKDSTLLNQAFIKESKQTVSEFLKGTDKGLTVTGFFRYNLAD
ncbi:MAG TPA: elongation factor Ts, partial [Prolixibacteraceae bacterium]